MFDANTLDYYGACSYRRRAETGGRCIALAFNGPWSPLAADHVRAADRETYAVDAISHILTALLGPAGVTVEEPNPATTGDWRVKYDQAALDKAQDILQHALESYRGDAEDYTLKA